MSKTFTWLPWPWLAKWSQERSSSIIIFDLSDLSGDCDFFHKCAWLHTFTWLWPYWDILDIAIPKTCLWLLTLTLYKHRLVLYLNHWVDYMYDSFHVCMVFSHFHLTLHFDLLGHTRYTDEGHCIKPTFCFWPWLCWSIGWSCWFYPYVYLTRINQSLC